MNQQASVQQHQQQQQSSEQSTVVHKRTPTANGDVTARSSGNSNCTTNSTTCDVKGLHVTDDGDGDGDALAPGGSCSDDSDTKQGAVHGQSRQSGIRIKRKRRMANVNTTAAATRRTRNVGPAWLTSVGDGETGGHECTIQCMNNSNNRSTSRKSSNNCEDERALEKQSKASTSKETSRTFQMKDPLTMDPIYHPHYSGHCNSGYVLDAGDDDDDDDDDDDGGDNDQERGDEGDYDEMKKKKILTPSTRRSLPVPKLTRAKETAAAIDASVQSVKKFFTYKNKPQLNKETPATMDTGKDLTIAQRGHAATRSGQFGRTPDGRTFRRRTLWKTSSFGTASSVVSTSNSTQSQLPQQQQQQQQQQGEQFPLEVKNKPKGETANKDTQTHIWMAELLSALTAFLLNSSLSSPLFSFFLFSLTDDTSLNTAIALQ